MCSNVSFNDPVVQQRGVAVLKLLVLEDEALLAGWDVLLGSDQGFDVGYGVGGLNVVRGGVAIRVLHEDLQEALQGALLILV